MKVTVKSEGGRVTFNPDAGFVRRLNEELTFQYQVVWEVLSGYLADDGPTGTVEVTERWKERALAELRILFGKKAEERLVEVCAVRFDPQYADSWGAVKDRMAEILRDWKGG